MSRTTLWMLWAPTAITCVLIAAYHLLGVLLAHNVSTWLVTPLEIVEAVMIMAGVVVVIYALINTALIVRNRRSRAQFYYPYRVRDARETGVPRMSKRRAVAYANSGLSASEARELEFAASSGRP